MTNLFLLFCVLILLLMTSFMLNGRDIFTISFISTGVFTLSVGYALVGFEHFATDITYETACVIVGALTAILLGECLAKALVQRNKYICNGEKSAESIARAFEPIEIRKLYVYFLFLLSLALGIVRYHQLYLISLRYGNPHNLFKAIAYTRAILIEGELEGNRFLSYGCVFCMAAVYTAIFIFFYNWILCSMRDLRLLLPVIAYLLIPLSSTGRVEYIQYLVAVFTMFVICYRRSRGWDTKGNFKILLSAIAGFTAFLCVFRLIGLLRDKWNLPSDVMTNLIGYLSAGIYGLNHFLDTGSDAGLVFGYDSLAWLYAILNRFFSTQIPVVNFQPFYSVGNIVSNTYTGLKPYIQDFSISGMLAICFILSFIDTLWLYSIKVTHDPRNCFMRIIGFSVFLYPIVMLSVAGTFNGLLTTGYVLFFVLLSMFNKLLIKPKRNH